MVTAWMYWKGKTGTNFIFLNVSEAKTKAQASKRIRESVDI